LVSGGLETEDIFDGEKRVTPLKFIPLNSARVVKTLDQWTRLRLWDAYDEMDIERLSTLLEQEFLLARNKQGQANATTFTEQGLHSIGLTEQPELLPLTDREQSVYEYICSNGPVTGKQICNAVGCDQSTLTTHIIPALKEKRGILLKRGAGYYSPTHYSASAANAR
jgi:chromosome segregation and condensation protein ScpB